MKDFLLEPSYTYICEVESGLHCLSDPKQKFNDDLHSIGRLQGINALIVFLTVFKYPQPHKTAQYVYDNFVCIPIYDFNKLNVDKYNGLKLCEYPKHIQNTFNGLCDKFERNSKRTYSYNDWALGVKYDKKRFF
jgi:hypothetical protein